MIAKLVTLFELTDEAKRKHRSTSEIEYSILEEEAIGIGGIRNLKVR